MENCTTIRFEKQAFLNIQESILIGKKVLEQKLAACKNRLTGFEKTKQMDTPTFLRLFEQGELGDQKEWIEWEHFALAAKRLKKKLDDLESIRYEH